jgi:membrane-bound lytic murein transglycosylase A
MAKTLLKLELLLTQFNRLKSSKIMNNILSLFVVLTLLAGCFLNNKIVIKGDNNIKLEQVNFYQLDSWNEDNQKKALIAFINSCNKMAKMAANKNIGGKIGTILVSDFRDVCDIAEVVKTMSNKQARNFFENWFKVFKVSYQNNHDGLFTGYYEASLNGSFTKSERYQYPIYAKPDDLTSGEYYSREEIENGALDDRNLELLYVDDYAELFFLHIQGSGRIIIDDKKVIRVGFAGRNNHEFSGVTSYMIEKNYIKKNQTSSEDIKNWLKENPNLAQEVMNQNPAFTFFKINDAEQIVGAQGSQLVEERSLAVDDNFYGYGFPIWLETNLTLKNNQREKFHHLMVMQDTGNAIKGAVRGDIFFGFGKKAEEKASYMSNSGKYYILLPITAVDRIMGI